MSENKKVITISVDPDVLQRIDAACGARGEPRSAFIERMVRNGLVDEEGVVSDMESPVYRAVLGALKESDAFWKLLAGLMGKKIGSEEIAGLREQARVQIERGKERNSRRRARRQDK